MVNFQLSAELACTLDKDLNVLKQIDLHQNILFILQVRFKPT